VAETGARSDPAASFRFEVTIDELAPGGFSECTGLQLETEVQDYVEGGQNEYVHKFPTRTKQSNLTFKRGIVDRALWDWYFDTTQGRIRLRDGTIAIRDPSGERVLAEWQFRGAFPCKWTGPDLNATQTAVAVETFELCHQRLERRT
jgi:phage tail-like protein